MKSRDCYYCDHCMYVLEGDYVCDLEVAEDANVVPIMEEHMPTAHFMWCGGMQWIDR